jgi:hypothetical protein
MTNTYMLNGDKDPEEIIKSVKKGLYAVNFGGGQVDITSGKFVFSTSEAYLIENGKVTRPVKGATLIGNGPDALTKVKMIGNDMMPGSGCGHLRQGRPECARGCGPADAAYRRADGGRHGLRRGGSPRLHSRLAALLQKTPRLSSPPGAAAAANPVSGLRPRCENTSDRADQVCAGLSLRSSGVVVTGLSPLQAATVSNGVASSRRAACAGVAIEKAIAVVVSMAAMVWRLIMSGSLEVLVHCSTSGRSPRKSSGVRPCRCSRR